MNQRKIGAIISYITIIISTAISLLYTPFMLKSLGQSEYGLFSLVNSVVAYFTIMDFGFGNAIIRFSAKFIANDDEKSESELLGMFFIIYSILAAIILLLGIVLAFNSNLIFSRSFTDEELRITKVLLLIATLNISLSFFFKIYNASIQAHQRFAFSKLTSLFKSILNPLLMVIILKFGYKSIGMIIGITILNLIFSLVEFVYFKLVLKIKITPTLKNKLLLKEIVIYSFFIFLNLIVDKINWSTDQLILGIIVGTVGVSIYSVASNINSYYLTFSTAISGVFLPETTTMVAKEAPDEDFSNLFIKVGRIQYLILALILSGYIIYGRYFLNLWVGEEYKDAFWVGLFLIVPITIPLTQNIGITILQAKNLHKFRSLVYAGIAIVNVIISIPLTIYYGPIGSAIGTAISIIIGNIIIMNIYYYKKLHFDIISYWFNILKISLVLIIPILSSFIIIKYIPIHSWMTLGINIICYSVIYIISMWLIGMSTYEKDLIRKPINKLANKIRG